MRMQTIASTLQQSLEPVLPKGYEFEAYHISTPPSRTAALYSAPPKARPDKTYVEKHFLAISIDATPSKLASRLATERDTTTAASDLSRVIVLALEIYIFTTAYTSTFFVSKADSTGYLHLLGKLPAGTPSLAREITTTFLGFLLHHRRRPGIQHVISLFARAQDQYLFPGSIENSDKHVLDDRGLVKWWCRVLDPLACAAHDGVVVPSGPASHERDARQPLWSRVKGYIVVPGLDHYETRVFIPNPAIATNNGDAGQSRWVVGHPLEHISHYCREYDWVPPRCLIPSFPDDPKSRFRDELDEETAKSSLVETTGLWKSVRTLDQFWEMMAFRQECSSGRMTGFIWLVFDPVVAAEDVDPKIAKAQHTPPNTPPKLESSAAGSLVAQRTTPQKLLTSSQRISPAVSKSGLGNTNSHDHNGNTANADTETSARKNAPNRRKAKKALTGPVKARQPRFKTRLSKSLRTAQPESTAYFRWPMPGRGRKLVDEQGYKRVVELLLRLDFATLELATGSTRKWVTEVNVVAGPNADADQTDVDAALNGTSPSESEHGNGWGWGARIVGTRPAPSATTQGEGVLGDAAASQHVAVVNNLSGLVKRKRVESTAAVQAANTKTINGVETQAVNVLSAGQVRKKHQG